MGGLSLAQSLLLSAPGRVSEPYAPPLSASTAATAMPAPRRWPCGSDCRRTSCRRLLLLLHAAIELERLGQPLEGFEGVRFALKHDVLHA